MGYGKVRRAPAYGAGLTSVELGPAQGKHTVAVHDGNFVGVAAPSSEEAESALAAIHAEWKSQPQPSSKDLFDYLKKTTDKKDDDERYETGDVDKALTTAALRLQQTYTVSYIPHVPPYPRPPLPTS